LLLREVENALVVDDARDKANPIDKDVKRIIILIKNSQFDDGGNQKCTTQTLSYYSKKNEEKYCDEGYRIVGR
jgi:hypothetical protein